MAQTSRITDPSFLEQRSTSRTGSVQGLYVMGPDGQMYGWINDKEPSEVNRFLDRALAAYKRSPPHRVDVPSSLIQDRYTTPPAASTSVVRVFSRIRPLPPGADRINESVGRDHLWIYGEDIREILAAARSAGNASFRLPSSLVGRMARYHLIDNVRGEPDMWENSDVRKADFTARQVGSQGNIAKFAMAGTFQQCTSSNKRGLQGSIQGEFEIDEKTMKIAHFRAFAWGQAWGESTYCPGAPKSYFPMVFALVDSDDRLAHAVPPQALAWEDDYVHPHLPILSHNR